jgi:hypothetical protein
MDIIKYGKVNRGYIGINIRSAGQTEAEALDFEPYRRLY